MFIRMRVAIDFSVSWVEIFSYQSFHEPHYSPLFSSPAYIVYQCHRFITSRIPFVHRVTPLSTSVSTIWRIDCSFGYCLTVIMNPVNFSVRETYIPLLALISHFVSPRDSQSSSATLFSLNFRIMVLDPSTYICTYMCTYTYICPSPSVCRKLLFITYINSCPSIEVVRILRFLFLLWTS